ncbi:hypothetical protein [Microseira sp. BLCC-F43]
MIYICYAIKDFNGVFVWGQTPDPERQKRSLCSRVASERSPPVSPQKP